MKTCNDCRNRGKKRRCDLYTSMSTYAEKCKDFEEKKQTNADRIRSFSDEELAMNMMCPNESGLGEIECEKSDNCNCYACILKWLQSEVEV